MKRNEVLEGREFEFLARLKYQDIQRELIKRGAPFEEVGGASVFQLYTLYPKYADNNVDETLLYAYDKWLEDILRKSGKYPDDCGIYHNDLKMATYTFKTPKEDDIVIKPTIETKNRTSIPKPEIKDDKKKEPKPKPDNTKNTKNISKDVPKSRASSPGHIEGTNVKSGTKKGLTYKLTKQLLPIAEIITQVIAEFPEANGNSIKIWHKRCLKEMKLNESLV